MPLKQIDDPMISCRFHCICPDKDMRKCTDRRDIPASNAWVPSAAGLIIGGEVVKDLIVHAGTMRIQPQDIESSTAAQHAAQRAQQAHEKYRKIVAEKKAGTWVDDKVVMKLPEGF